ncbi:hypothetical protein Tco_0349493 [Tanacetum coccineum]
MIKRYLNKEGFGKWLEGLKASRRERPTKFSVKVLRLRRGGSFEDGGTDIANITRKEPKPDKNGHGNEKSAQEPEVFYQQWSTKSQQWSNLVNPQEDKNP